MRSCSFFLLALVGFSSDFTEVEDIADGEYLFRYLGLYITLFIRSGISGSCQIALSVT